MAVSAPTVKLRTVALPAEHGGWGFLLTPILLGLVAAPSLAGLTFSLASLGVFLLHQPAKIFIKDRRKGLDLPRTRLARRVLVFYSAAALLLLLPVLATHDPVFVVPVLVASPIALVQLYYDARNQSRALVPEIAGAAALGAIAAAVGLLAGWSMRAALVLWLVDIAWAAPAIFYIRARLRLEKSKPPAAWLVWVAYGVALGAMALLGQVGALLAVLILLGRAVLGLSPYRWERSTPMIGAMEMVYGVITALLAGLV